ncbi:MAG: hypothetical protein QXG21_02985, partial [Candidatus Caldarchaeum sp.]
MASFATLEVWQTPEIRGKLSWYYEVAINKMPAKYLLCRRVEVDENPSLLDEASLWQIHRRAAEKFNKIRREIRDGTISLKELTPARPNYL